MQYDVSYLSLSNVTMERWKFLIKNFPFVVRFLWIFIELKYYSNQINNNNLFFHVTFY